jgi:hypothetical protein
MNAFCANYQTVRGFVDRFKKRCKETDLDDVGIVCEFPSSNFSAMVDALGPTVQPFFQKGVLAATDSVQVCQSSTIVAPNVSELLHISAPSNFTRGTTAVTNHADITIVNSFEVATAKLSQNVFSQLSQKFPIQRVANGKALELRPYKLVVHQKGAHPDAHRDSLCGDGHIGTLVLILNSKYTGGELEITHNGQTEVVTGPYSWVAMYGDCLHKINPVTSGTRVSLIFDIVIDWNSTPKVETFWYKETAALPGNAVQAAAAPVMNAQQKAALTKALKHELSSLTSVLIALDQLYDATAALPAALQGGDQTLHALLAEDFELTLAHCAVHHTTCHVTANRHYGQQQQGPKISAELFTTFNKGPLDVYGPAAAQPNANFNIYGLAAPSKRRPVRAEWARTKLVLPHAPGVHHVYDYASAASNSSEEVYIFSVLQVCKKKVIKTVKGEMKHEDLVEVKEEGKAVAVKRKRKQAGGGDVGEDGDGSSGSSSSGSGVKMITK